MTQLLTADQAHRVTGGDRNILGGSDTGGGKDIFRGAGASRLQSLRGPTGQQFECKIKQPDASQELLGAKNRVKLVTTPLKILKERASLHQSATLNYSHLHSDKSVDISTVTPRILQLELGTLISSISDLKNKISALQKHAIHLESPNEQTNSTLRIYFQDITRLEDRSSKLFDRFDNKITPATRTVMEQVFCNASSLRKSLTGLYDICSTDLKIPEISAELLSSVKIPKLNVTKFKSPGFFCQSRDLLNHIKTNHFQEPYYIQQILKNLKQTDRIVYNTLMQGSYPQSVTELLENICTTFLPPIRLEQISIEVLTKKGRLVNPTGSVNIKENTESEILKRHTFSAVLLNIIQMYEFYKEMFIEDPKGFHNYVHAGCYTPKFCSVLLECNPREHKMKLLTETANLDYRSQIHHFF